MIRRSVPVVLSCLLIAGSACAPSHVQPQETAILRSPSSAVPAYLREVVSGKTIALHVPREMHAAAVDYLRAAGAIVVEGGQTELQLDGAWRSETLYYPAGLTVNNSRVQGQRAIVELKLKGLRKDGSRQILFQGLGDAAYQGHTSSRAVDMAGRRALLNLH